MCVSVEALVYCAEAITQCNCHCTGGIGLWLVLLNIYAIIGSRSSNMRRS